MMDVQLFSAVPDTRLRDELLAEALGVAVAWYGRIDETEATVGYVRRLVTATARGWAAR